MLVELPNIVYSDVIRHTLYGTVAAEREGPNEEHGEGVDDQRGREEKGLVVLCE